MHGGVPHPDAQVRVPLAMLNRHGLIAGATGTGKTKTLQVIAEQLSAAGRARRARRHQGRPQRAGPAGRPRATGSPRARTGTGDPWAPTSYPVEFLSLGGLGPGVPVRATMTDFGPVLLSKVLDLNPTQESSLGLIFHYADDAGLPLLDLKDLRSVVSWLVSDEGKPQLKSLGGLSSATAGVILRNLIGLEELGGDVFFGEPEWEPADILRTAADGRGVISAVELAAVQDRPALFSTFLMWLLAELFEELPEVGDLDKPKLVFFFDEAHLLFNGASKAVPGVGDADGAAHPVEGRRHLLRDAEPDRRPQRGARASWATGCSTPCARSPPRTRRRSARPCRRSPSPTTTTSPRCSPRWARARRRSPCSPSAGRPPRWRGRCCARPARSWRRSIPPS